MKWPYKILRTILVSLLVLAAVIPASLYIALSFPSVQDKVRRVACDQLSEILGTQVKIGSVGIAPFNSVTLRDVIVTDSLGAKALEVERLGAGIDLMKLFRGDIVVTYAEIVGLHARIYRVSPKSPLNIEPIIHRLQSKDKHKPPTRFSLAINTIVIRKSTINYDILSAPASPAGRFNASHIGITSLRADINIPRLSNDYATVDIKRMAFNESGGMRVTSLTALVEYTPSDVSVRNFAVEFPGSRIPVNDFGLEFGTLDNLRQNWRDMEVSISLGNGAHVTPSDFSSIVPGLASLDQQIDITAEINGSPADFDINRLTLDMHGFPFKLNLEGRASGLTDGMSSATFTIPTLDIDIDAGRLLPLLQGFFKPTPATAEAIGKIGPTKLSGEIFLSPATGRLKSRLESQAGIIDLNASLDRHLKSLKASANTAALDVSRFFPSHNLSANNLSVDFKGNASAMDVEISADAISAAGNSFTGFHAKAAIAGKSIDGEISTGGNAGDINLLAAVDLDRNHPMLRANGNLMGLDLAALGIKMPKQLHGYLLDADINADISGSLPDNAVGNISLSRLNFTNNDGNDKKLEIGDIDIVAESDSTGRKITLKSDIVNATATGHFRIATLVKSVKSILASVDDSLFGLEAYDTDIYDDNLNIALTIEPENSIFNFFNLPVEPISPVTVNGFLNNFSHTLTLTVDAPYLKQKDKLIEKTTLQISLDGTSGTSALNAYTLFPAKGGIVGLSLNSHGLSSQHDTELTWTNASGHNRGNFRFSTGFSRDDHNRLVTAIDVNPGQIIFNDTIWTISQSHIDAYKNFVSVDGFKISHARQLLYIDGAASADSTSVMNVKLRDINLDYVFETLNISSNVMFGGDATGTIIGRGLLSGRPEAYTDDLAVKGLSYNHCVMGDGLIRSAWHPESGAISINAVIDQANGHQSHIDGTITPVGEKLDFTFNADHANVGFLQPFMAAFCDGISGEASGRARLYGTFKLLDMTGDIYAHNLKMDLGLTGTSYWTSDSVHISPGRIGFDNITLRDAGGHTATLNGLLTHDSFHDPVFDFQVTEARDFLCYDIKENKEQPWFGKVYGTGTVGISGRPGIVDIDVDMATASGTDFTFVLSEEEVASDYNFLTFRDVTPKRQDDADESQDSIPDLVKLLKKQMQRKQDESSSDYLMSFNIDVTPQARMTLVMDPVGGDKIRTTGSGNLRMTYGSANEDLRMYGTYTLQRGSYNFTLQDIIIKDFTIENGSSIAFHGDPYSAQLDIRAYYALNANLSDLDDSFLQDRELNRTNVPVHAMLLVTGDMRSPDINFDLEFPTLTQDTYRKVRSIVSTEDMMNRQIIYLLALNRFYTPEYMSATKGNELVSVASSTISSQLSSMLGQLSDKFSIAPSFRSDRGDFSDVEVDVALSSHLLNNRLLFNGNFGYRDKSLNNNSFIGDFDIEYLLNRSGSLRLKAYNRYNDQNYYLKSALTTQGVGIIYKRDFDNIFDFIYRMRRKWKARHTSTDSQPAPADTIVTSEKQ